MTEKVKYEFTEDLHCHNNGRPSVDPVVHFKIVMIQHLFGIPSLSENSRCVFILILFKKGLV